MKTAFRKAAGWITLGLGLLIVFTLIKFPERKLKALLQNQVIAQAANAGISLAYTDSDLDIIPRPRYTLIDVTVGLRSQNVSLHFDRLEVTPRILSIFMGKPGAEISFTEKESIGTVDFVSSGNQFEVDCRIETLRLKDVPIQRFAQGIQMEGALSGTVAIQGDLQNYTTMQGQIDLTLKNVSLPSQNIMGFQIPEIRASEGKTLISLKDSKALVSSLRLGKRAGGPNELYLEAAGEITLARSLFASTLKLRTKFKPPNILLEQMPYIQPMIEEAKTPDGVYGFEISGPITFPRPTPSPNVRL